MTFYGYYLRFFGLSSSGHLHLNNFYAHDGCSDEEGFKTNPVTVRGVQLPKHKCLVMRYLGASEAFPQGHQTQQGGPATSGLYLDN